MNVFITSQSHFCKTICWDSQVNSIVQIFGFRANFPRFENRQYPPSAGPLSLSLLSDTISNVMCLCRNLLNDRLFCIFIRNAQPTNTTSSNSNSKNIYFWSDWNFSSNVCGSHGKGHCHSRLNRWTLLNPLVNFLFFTLKLVMTKLFSEYKHIKDFCSNSQYTNFAIPQKVPQGCHVYAIQKNAHSKPINLRYFLLNSVPSSHMIAYPMRLQYSFFFKASQL